MWSITTKIPGIEVLDLKLHMQIDHMEQRCTAQDPKLWFCDFFFFFYLILQQIGSLSRDYIKRVKAVTFKLHNLDIEVDHVEPLTIQSFSCDLTIKL